MAYGRSTFYGANKVRYQSRAQPVADAPTQAALDELWTYVRAAGRNIPTGAIMFLPCDIGTEELEGWLLCDGSKVSTLAYPELFNRWGTLYGGDGINTFGLPDLRETGIWGWGADPRATDRAGTFGTLTFTSDSA